MKQHTNKHMLEPGVYDEDAQRIIFDRGAKLVVEKNRAYLATIILSIACLTLSSAIAIMIPLQKVEPYRVSKDEKGRYVADFSAFDKYTPDQAIIEGSLRQFTKNMFTVLGYDQAVVGLEEARIILTGPAKNQFAEWFMSDQPTIIAREKPNYTRSIEVASSSILPNNVCIIRFKTKTYSGDSDSKSLDENKLLTIRYIVKKPKSKEEAIRNPSGVYVDHFTIDLDKQQ